MKCEYCGTENKSGASCVQCGASLQEVKSENPSVRRSQFIFYNGYLVVYIEHYASDELEVQFWLGKEMQERILVSRRWMDEHIPHGQDSTPIFWHMFLLAKGEIEVLFWESKNNKPYVRFEMRRIDESPSYVKIGDRILEEA